MKMCLCDVNRLKYLIEIYKFYKHYFNLYEDDNGLSGESIILNDKYMTFMEQLEKDISETNNNLAGEE